jgi:hypothetical protein
VISPYSPPLRVQRVSEKRADSHSVCLYDDGGAPDADLPQIASYLGRLEGIDVSIAGSVTSRLPKTTHPESAKQGHRGPFGSIEDAAKALAGARVHNLTRRDSFEEPLPAEIDFIARQLSRSAPRRFGHLYDAMAAMSVYRTLIKPDGDPAIVFTYQLMATWDEEDLKYHARVLVAGSPSIISIPGVVLAPARPREYYMYQAGARAAGLSDEEIDERMRQAIGDRFVRHGDPRIPEIIKGYALQAVAYWVFGEGFCEDPDCRLFNAHWQEEMLRAQLDGPYELCPRHEAMLRGKKD